MADDLKNMFRAGKAQRGLDSKPIKEKYKKPSSDLKPSGNQQQQQQAHLPADFFAPDNQKNATAVGNNNIDQDYAELMRDAHQQEEPAPAIQPSSVIPKDNDETQQQQADTVPGKHNEEEAAQEEEERREFEQFVRQQRLEEIKRAAAEKVRTELDPLILDNDDASIPSSLSLIGGMIDGSRDLKRKKKLAHTIAALENIESGSDTDSREEEEEEELLNWRAKRVKEGRK